MSLLVEKTGLEIDPKLEIDKILVNNEININH